MLDLQLLFWLSFYSHLILLNVSKNRIEECSIDSENTLDIGYPHDNCDYCDISETSNLNLTDSDLVCVQWNIRGILGKQGDVSNFLFDCMGKKKIDIVILVETWLTKSSEKKLNIPGFNFVGNHRRVKREEELVS